MPSLRLAPFNIENLFDHKGQINLLTRLPEAARGMPYCIGGNPAVLRRGLPWHAQKVTEERLDGFGENAPKASDHATLYMDITLTRIGSSA